MAFPASCFSEEKRRSVKFFFRKRVLIAPEKIIPGTIDKGICGRNIGAESICNVDKI